MKMGKRMKTRTMLFAAAGIGLLVAMSCNPAKKYEKEEEEKIQNFISSHPEYSFVRKPSGLYYCELITGTGVAAAMNDTAYVKYIVRYLSLDTIDSNINTDDTLRFTVGKGMVIEGLDEGVRYMSEDGRSLMIIPSYLGYGNSGYYFPSYTPILLDAFLVRLEKPSGK
jgi:FKBP-type peptidyl-prolyl cis-trans isomerase